jgi:hypothetical protein
MKQDKDTFFDYFASFLVQVLISLILVFCLFFDEVHWREQISELSHNIVKEMRL